MLKFRRSNTAAQPGDIPSSLSGAKDSGAQLDRKCSFVTSQLGHSKAAILIRNLSLPLAWPVEEYFGAKKEWREFTVQLGLGPSQKQPAGIQQQQFSRPLTNINRTYTDVEFPDEFVFAGQGPDFCIELTVYCKRTDESGAASMVQNISRSLGRSFGLSWRKYQQQQQELTAAGKGAPNRSFLEELRRAGIREEQRLAAGGGAGQTSTSAVPSSAFLPHSATVDEGFLQGWPQSHSAHGGVKMHPIAIAHFRLRNATLSGKTHSYTLERLPAADLGRQQLLPIYGNISAQILVQPSSLVTPLAQGSMDIFLSDAGILHQHLRCVLQGGRLRCWDPKATLDRRTAATSLLADASMDPLSKLAALKTPLLCLNIGEKTILERTAFPTAFRLSLQQQQHQQEDNDAQTAGVSHLLCICPTQRALIGWRNALQLQQLDCAVWSEFAVAQKNPHASALGILAGAEPPPFQPLASHNSLDMDNNGLAPVANKQTKSKIPKPAEVYDGIVSEKTSEVNPKSHRPRIGSSASLLVRSVSSHRQPQKPVRIKSFALSQEEEEEEKGSRMRPAGPSRTTLVETTLPTPTQSPLLARKMAQQQPQNSSPTAPRTGLARRLTQQQQQSTKGVQRHISWSLGHHPEKPKKERPSAHQHFQQQENMKTFQQHQRHSAIDAKLPSKNTSEGIAEELPTENTGGGGGDGLRQRQSAMEEKQHPTMRKSNTDFPTTRTAAGAFVISLRIGEADEEGILQRNSGKQHNKNNEDDILLLPAQGHNPSKYATIGGTTNSSTFLTPTSRPMDLSRSGSNHTLITSTPSTSIGPLISNRVSAADSHRIRVNESMPKSSNSNAVKFGGQRPNGRADRTSNPTTKTAATTVNADTASFQQRPFNINLGSANFEKSPGQSQSQQQGRWARAHIGRTETWHFARTSEACTRL